MSRQTDPVRDDTMRALREARVPYATIARTFNLTRQRVQQILGPSPTRVVEVEPTAPPLPWGLILKNQADMQSLLPEAMYLWRTRRGYTQPIAADIFGCHHISWSAWETRRRRVQIPSIPWLFIQLTDKLEAAGHAPAYRVSKRGDAGKRLARLMLAWQEKSGLTAERAAAQFGLKPATWRAWAAQRSVSPLTGMMLRLLQLLHEYPENNA